MNHRFILGWTKSGKAQLEGDQGLDKGGSKISGSNSKKAIAKQ